MSIQNLKKTEELTLLIERIENIKKELESVTDDKQNLENQYISQIEALLDNEKFNEIATEEEKQIYNEILASYRS